MKVNLKQLFSITGESKDISYSIQTDELSDLKGCSFSQPVEINGRIYNRAGVVYLDYNAHFTTLLTCDRCLSQFAKEYSFDFSHIVVPSASADNDEYIVADGESIEMNEIAITDILLQLPSKILCSEDCKGLCMVCGCNLNVSECNCLK